MVSSHCNRVAYQSGTSFSSRRLPQLRPATTSIARSRAEAVRNSAVIASAGANDASWELGPGGKLVPNRLRGRLEEEAVRWWAVSRGDRRGRVLPAGLRLDEAGAVRPLGAELDGLVEPPAG
jgi:hypothetical protein